MGFCCKMYDPERNYKIWYSVVMVVVVVVVVPSKRLMCNCT